MFTSFTVTAHNYRAFGDPAPARFHVRPGFTSFVGPNNAGKSSLLRIFYELRDVFRQIGEFPLHNWNHQLGVTLTPPVADYEELFNNKNTNDLSIEIRLDDVPHSRRITVDGSTVRWIKSIELVFKRERPSCNVKIRDASDFEHRVTTSGTAGDYEGLWSRDVPDTLLEVSEIRNVCQCIANSIYLPSFRNVVSGTGSAIYYDLHIGSGFVEQWHRYSTSQSNAEKRMVIDVRRLIQRVFDIEDLQIVANTQAGLLEFNIDGQPYKLTELGSGLSQFVLSLFALMSNKSTFALIDEPETGLHPLLQREYLSSIAELSTEKTVLFSTHSLGLARSISEKIYSVSRDKSLNISKVRDFDEIRSLPEFLGEMSFSGAYDLGYRTILLVEGPHDLKAIQQFLRKLNADHLVTLIPLGGSSLINDKSSLALGEILRITSSVYAMIDSDRTAPGAPAKKSARDFANICKTAGIPCLVYERRAIENYLTDPHVGAVMGQGITALGPFDEIPKGWSKGLDWQVASLMQWSDVESTDVGKFLSKLTSDAQNEFAAS